MPETSYRDNSLVRVKKFAKNHLPVEMYSVLASAARLAKQEVRKKADRRSRHGLNLNVGSGSYPIDGFISLDLDSEWYRVSGRQFTPYNMITDDLPYGDGSVDNIYCSHVIEHLPDEVVLRFLTESHRVLRQGGTLRIACPDAEFLWEVSSFPNGYWKWRDEWFSDSATSSDATVTPRRSDYFVREVATPNCTLYRNRRGELEYDDSLFDTDFDTAVRKLKQGLEFSAEFPGDHINAWSFLKVRDFANSVGFNRVVRSKQGASVSEIMQHSDFDRTCPNMSLYVDIVKT